MFNKNDNQEVRSRNMAAPRVSEEIKESDSNMFEGMISIRAVLSTDCKNRRITKLLYSKERTEKKRRENSDGLPAKRKNTDLLSKLRREARIDQDGSRNLSTAE